MAPSPQSMSTNIREHFRRWGEMTAAAMGTPAAFFIAVATVAIWAISGPYFGFSDTWQLVINTGTTIVTFLIVFLIQGTQNRDTRILNLKLDELLRAAEGARTSFCGLDNVSESELEQLQDQFGRLAERYGGLVGDDLEEVRRELAMRRDRRGNG
jgi:low affinity Fe/Cu permease